jgi:pyruvate-formate lyase
MSNARTVNLPIANADNSAAHQLQNQALEKNVGQLTTASVMTSLTTAMSNSPDFNHGNMNTSSLATTQTSIIYGSKVGSSPPIKISVPNTTQSLGKKINPSESKASEFPLHSIPSQWNFLDHLKAKDKEGDSLKLNKKANGSAKHVNRQASMPEDDPLNECIFELDL